MKKKVGNYEIVKELGKGGMSTIYLAIQKSLNRRVAIKELLPLLKTDTEMVERFKREAKASAAMAHEGIVNIFDFWVERGSYYLAMEYLEGKDVGEVIEKTGSIPVEATVTIASKAADALHYAHQRGIIHRDVKSGNIFITHNGEIKLTDFGIAYVPGKSPLTQPGITIGTPEYMSPEQIRGEKADPRSDIFSIGVVLYEMLTGTRPFGEDGDEEVIASVLGKKPKGPRKMNKEVPWGLHRLTMKCLQKRPEKRFQTMEDLKISLDRFLPKKSKDRTSAFSSFLEMIFPPEGMDVNPAQFRRKKRVSFGYALVVIIALVSASLIYRYHKTVNFSSFLPKRLKDKIGFLAHMAQGDSFIKIVVYPWARVTIDGKYVDTTPIADPIRLKPGEHTLSFSHSKFKSKTIEIVLKPGETRFLSVTLGS
ncbi:MAG: serine/threonine protein kinase [Syntrophobacterales bacterium]|nr:MAG: serine/threonine protein kinase [Syntrophobacterales bacterium]